MGLRVESEYVHRMAGNIQTQMNSVATPGLESTDDVSTIFANYNSQEAYQNSMSLIGELKDTLSYDANNIHTLAELFEKYDALMGQKNATVVGSGNTTSGNSNGN